MNQRGALVVQGWGSVRDEMTTGLNQNIDILGRVLHVQTELTPGEEPLVRTTVYDGGRIVATRETPVGPSSRADEEMRESIRRQHELIIDNMVRRSEELAARKRRMIAGTPGEPKTVEQGTSVARKIHSLPDPPGPSLQRSLACRRLVGPFSLALSSEAAGDPTSGDLLEIAVSWIGDITMSPVFPDLRLDEQVRFLDLRERFNDWRSGGLGPEESSELLWDAVAFADHLYAINQRQELAAFDHELLLWALGRISEDGLSDEVLEQLETQRGRDGSLDMVLDHPELADPERVPGILMSLIDRTLPD